MKNGINRQGAKTPSQIKEVIVQTKPLFSWRLGALAVKFLSFPVFLRHGIATLFFTFYRPQTTHFAYDGGS
jgi:hypothetical protein